MNKPTETPARRGNACTCGTSQDPKGRESLPANATCSCGPACACGADCPCGR